MISIDIVAEEIGVDTGTILLSDKEWYLKNGGDVPEGGYVKQYPIPPGKYHVEWNIEGTWKGDVNGEGDLVIYSGVLVVSDPGYGFDVMIWEKWDELLKRTNYLEDLHDPKYGVVLLDKMGGDGVYDVNIHLELTN